LPDAALAKPEGGCCLAATGARHARRPNQAKILCSLPGGEELGEPGHGLLVGPGLGDPGLGACLAEPPVDGRVIRVRVPAHRLPPVLAAGAAA
jgi:hypothetical protein